MRNRCFSYPWMVQFRVYSVPPRAVCLWRRGSGLLGRAELGLRELLVPHCKEQPQTADGLRTQPDRGVFMASVGEKDQE